MRTERFPLEPGAPERLSIARGHFAFNNINIAFDGKPVLAGLTSKQLLEGVSLTLPDGSHIFVRRVAAGLFRSDQNGLELTRNGMPVPGSIGTPEHALRTAKGAGMLLYVLAGLNFAFGAYVQFAGEDPLFSWNSEGAWPVFLSALVMALLGYFVHRRRSLIALVLAMGYLAIDGFMSAIFQMEATGRPVMGGLVMRMFIVIFLLGAFKVIRRYKKAQQAA